MSAHKSRWYACCGLGKGWHRHSAKKSRRAARREIARQVVEHREKA